MITRKERPNSHIVFTVAKFTTLQRVRPSLGRAVYRRAIGNVFTLSVGLVRVQGR